MDFSDFLNSSAIEFQGPTGDEGLEVGRTGIRLAIQEFVMERVQIRTDSARNFFPIRRRIYLVCGIQLPLFNCLFLFGVRGLQSLTELAKWRQR